MASLRSILTAKPIVRPQQITRYNDLRTVTFNGTAPAGAPAAMERVSQQVLPPDFSCEWTGTALEQQAAAGRTLYILAIAAMFAYLFLVSLYESWASRSRCCSRAKLERHSASMAPNRPTVTRTICSPRSAYGANRGR